MGKTGYVYLLASEDYGTLYVGVTCFLNLVLRNGIPACAGMTGHNVVLRFLR